MPRICTCIVYVLSLRSLPLKIHTYLNIPSVKLPRKKPLTQPPFKQAKMCGSVHVHAIYQVLREIEFTIICYTNIRLDFVFMLMINDVK